MSKMSRRIVVDASVARSAGETEHPVSAACRDFMLTMLTVCHQVVLTVEIEREWKKHGSNFAVIWLAAMRRRRKVVHVVPDAEVARLLGSAVDRCSLDPVRQGAVRKDMLLVLAAWEADKAVASRDDRMRDLLASLVTEVEGLAGVVWVNPAAAAEGPLEWLRAGARPERDRRLGTYQVR
jgi:hypothetical protein